MVSSCDICCTGEEPKRPSLDSRPADARDNRSSYGGSSRGYDRGGRRDDRDRDRERDNDRGYDSRYPRRDRGEFRSSSLSLLWFTSEYITVETHTHQHSRCYALVVCHIMISYSLKPFPIMIHQWMYHSWNTITSTYYVYVCDQLLGYWMTLLNC